MKQRPDVMVVPKSTESSNKKRYSDSELREFQQIILAKLTDARRELANLQASLLNANDHGTDDTATTFKMLEDGSDSLAKEEAGQLAARQRKFIEQLENALVRIENKTYGVCRVTGKLIPKERLRAVPHTTQSIEAKAQQNGISFKEQEEALFRSVSIKEYVTPQQLADMVVYTASPRARTISGQAISVCGDTNMLG